MEERLQLIYKRYNDVLKPLVAEQEAKMQAFEEPLLLNLSLMFDYLSLAQSQNEEDQINLLLNKMNDMLDICISQSYMYIATAIKENIKQFDRHNNRRVQEGLRGGSFIGEYDKLKTEIREIDNRCKENKDDYLAHLNDYKASYEMCKEAERLIDSVNNTETLTQATKKSLFWKIFGFVVSIIGSALVGVILSKIFGR